MKKFTEQFVLLRQKLHQCAELSHHESKTKKILLDFLTPLAPSRVKNFANGKTLYVEFDSEKPGPFKILRADLDALPIPETKKLSYSSHQAGVSHKCGHDGHMALVCMAASLFCQGHGSGKLGLLFQHAEETGEGAKEVVADQDFTLKPDFIVGFHNIPTLSMGTVAVANDVFACASTGLRLSFMGTTSHAAYPDLAKNFWPDILELTQFAQSLVSKAHDDDFFLCSLVHLALGEEDFGITPGNGQVSFTLRAKKQTLLDQRLELLLQKAKELSSNLGLTLSHQLIDPFPSLEVHAPVSDIVRQAALDNSIQVKEMDFPYYWSEDFGHFTQKVPGTYFGLGIEIDHELHHPHYDFNDLAFEQYQDFFKTLTSSDLNALV